MNDERTSVAFRSAKARTFAERKATLVPPQIRRCPTTAQSFCAPKSDIAAQDYDLSLNMSKEDVHEEVDHCPPLEIMAELDRLVQEIQTGIQELGAMLR